MGLVKVVQEIAGVATGAVSGTLKDIYLETIVPGNMGPQTVCAPGVRTRQGKNVSGTDNTVSNGSTIQVYDNQMMILVDGGRVIDFTAEAGYYTVENSSQPALLTGQLGDTLKDTWERIKHGGETPKVQKVYYINLKEIRDLKFGTTNPVAYYDRTLDIDVRMKMHGHYSVKIVDPLKFYKEVLAATGDRTIEMTDLCREQLTGEFLTALQTAVNQLSTQNLRCTELQSRTVELAKYMRDALDDDWNDTRGLVIQSVSIPGFSVDDNTQQSLDMRTRGMALSNDAAQKGLIAAGVAQGIEKAASNEGGAMNGFIGMGMAMNTGSGVLGSYGPSHQQPPYGMPPQGQQQYGMPPQGQPQGQQQATTQQPVNSQPQANPQNAAVIAGAGAVAGGQQSGWKCACGAQNTGKFCPNCGKPQPVVENAEWTCACGAKNTGRFCPNCGKPRS